MASYPLTEQDRILMQQFKEHSEEGMTLVSTSYATGKDTDAESKLRYLIQLQRRALGPEHPETMRSMHFHAASLMALRRFTEAEAVLRDVVQLRQRVLGIEDPKTLISVRDLGNCMLQLGRDADAEPILRSVYKINKRVLGPGQWGTVGCQVILARCLTRLGQRTEAEALLRDALVALEQPHVEAEADHDWESLHAETMISLGHCLRACRDRHAEAEPLFRAAVALCRRMLDAQHKMTGIAMSAHAQCLTEMGRHKEALIMIRITLQHHERLYGPEDERTRSVSSRLAACLAAQAAAAVVAQRQSR